jgi:hypothetical protein
MASPAEIEDLKCQRFALRQLFQMARKSFLTARDAEGAANRAKLDALRIQEELRVRLEILDESIGDKEMKQEPLQTREDFKADMADNDNKDEHETNPGAA